MKKKTNQGGAVTDITNQDPSTIKVLTVGNNSEQVEASNQEDKMELARRDAYIDPKTRDLLRQLLQLGDKAEITPAYDPQEGFVYRMTNLDQKDAGANKLSIEFLGNLSALNLLEKKFFDTASGCPYCESTIMTMHTRCPRCKSHDILKTSLTEHIPCGNIDPKENYIENRCPKCGELLVNGKFRNMGRWYVCKACSERFENPEFDLVCHHCSKNFTLKDVQVLELPKFSLNLARKKEIRQNVASLEEIRVLLAELGFKIEIPGLVTGQKSGMQHRFSLIARKEVNRQPIVIALDHAISETEIQPQPLILYVYKISEVKVDIPIFIAIPKLNADAEKIAEGNHILLIEELNDQKEIAQRIKKEIEKLESQKNPSSRPDKEEKNSFFNKLKIKKV